jgi:integrase
LKKVISLHGFLQETGSMAAKLTSQSALTLQCPAGKVQELYPDAGKGSVPHLKLRVTRGSRSWVWEGTVTEDGKRVNRRQTIGDATTMSLDDAREQAAKRNREDAQPVNKTGSPTFRLALDAWWETKRRHWATGTIDFYQRIKDSFGDTWLDRPITSFTREEIQKLFHRIGDTRGESAAMSWIGVVRGVFRVAVAHDWIVKNPASVSKDGISGIQAYEKPEYEVDLDESQVAALDAGIASFPEPMSSYYRLLRLCGCRKSELQTMRWEQVNLAACTMKFLKEARKNKKGYTLLLDDESMELLRNLPSRDQSPYLLPSPFSSSCHMGKPRHQEWVKMLERAGLPTPVDGQGGTHIHALRHLYVDARLAEGVPPQDVADMIGDSLEMVLKVYRRRNTLDAQRRALELRRIKLNETRALETTATPVTVMPLLGVAVADDEFPAV